MSKDVLHEVREALQRGLDVMLDHDTHTPNWRKDGVAEDLNHALSRLDAVLAQAETWWRWTWPTGAPSWTESPRLVIPEPMRSDDDG